MMSGNELFDVSMDLDEFMHLWMDGWMDGWMDFIMI